MVISGEKVDARGQILGYCNVLFLDLCFTYMFFALKLCLTPHLSCLLSVCYTHKCCEVICKKL